MPVQVTAIMIGVKDLGRAKKFYGEGLGCTIDQDYPSFVSLSLGDGSSSLALYEWDAAAADAGVSAEGSGFRGVSFHYVVPSRDAVDEVMGDAVAAGGEQAVVVPVLDGQRPARRAAETLDQLAVLHLPDLDARVLGGGGEGVRVVPPAQAGDQDATEDRARDRADHGGHAHGGHHPPQLLGR